MLPALGGPLSLLGDPDPGGANIRGIVIEWIHRRNQIGVDHGIISRLAIDSAIQRNAVPGRRGNDHKIGLYAFDNGVAMITISQEDGWIGPV